MCTSLPLAKEEVADDLEARRRVQPGGVQHEPLPLSRRGHGAAARVSGRGQGVDEGARTRRCSWQAGQRGARGCPGRRDAARSMRRGARARGKARAPRGAGRSCRRSAAWRSEREGSVRAQRRRARGGRGRAARVEVGVETARAQRTGDGGVELPGTTAPAPASRGCRCTQSPRRRCRPERVTSPRAGEERARRGRGVASPCRTSRTSCHERRPSSRRRLTLRLILTGRICASKGSGSPGAVQRSGTGFLKLSGDASTTAAFEFGRTSACSSGIFASSTTALSDSWSKEAASKICADGSRWGGGRPVTGLRGARGGR